jgi:Inner membrane component of T3SS, cytoplasmic domain
MSFRLFIYYCALCGGWAAFVGWALARMLATTSRDVALAGIKGLFLGLFIALGLSLVDALWNLSLRQFGQVFLRVFVAVVVGCVGGLLGGMVGQVFYRMFDSFVVQSIFTVFGWTLMGLLIGTSVGVFEVLSSLVRQQDMSGSVKKVINGLLGGLAGGVLGGVLMVVFTGLFEGLFTGKDKASLWSPSSMGSVALGMCIGLLIGLAQVIFKEAWIKVESGFRAGREKILAKGEITIGRAESCDIGLFGDNAIERLHARILKRGNDYYLVDAGTQAGTFLNGRPVARPELLHTGDAIKVGNSLLRFGERQKRKQLQGM